MMHSWAKCPQRQRASAAVALGCRLLADFAASRVTRCLAHGLEAVAFADRLTFASIFSGFAVIHAFARSHTVAMNSSVGGLYLGSNTSKHSGGSDGQGSTGNGILDVHFWFLRVR
ncbi:hypothetical protein JBE38_10825 [Pseudomonas sp. ICBG1301]|nr:hypothetical protein [Pseudomonas sp. ICBG1301]